MLTLMFPPMPIGKYAGRYRLAERFNVEVLSTSGAARAASEHPRPAARAASESAPSVLRRGRSN